MSNCILTIFGLSDSIKYFYIEIRFLSKKTKQNKTYKKKKKKNKNKNKEKKNENQTNKQT